MPRLDDLNIKNKKVTKFRRTPLRPWDSIDQFKPANELVTNEEPIRNQKDTVSEPIDNQLVIEKEPIRYQLKTDKFEKVTVKEPISNPISNRTKEPIDNQLVTNSEALIKIKNLFGLQRKILFFIVKSCADQGLLATDTITNETLRLLCETDANTVKTAVQRLVNKGLMKRNEGKRGKGGYSTFEITTEIKNAILEIDRKLLFSNQLGTFIDNQLVTNKESKREPIPSSSSSLNINKTTTTEIPEAWKFDISDYATFGFGLTQLVQLIELSNEPGSRIKAGAVEQSLIEFKYSMDLKPDEITSRKAPIFFLMGILRKGNVYTSAAYLAAQQASIAERAQQIRELEKKNIENRFVVWLAELSEHDKELLQKPMPANLISAFNTYQRIGRMDQTLKDWMMGYFLNNCST